MRSTLTYTVLVNWPVYQCRTTSWSSRSFWIYGLMRVVVSPCFIMIGLTPICRVMVWSEWWYMVGARGLLKVSSQTEYILHWKDALSLRLSFSELPFIWKQSWQDDISRRWIKKFWTSPRITNSSCIRNLSQWDALCHRKCNIIPKRVAVSGQLISPLASKCAWHKRQLTALS